MIDFSDFCDRFVRPPWADLEYRPRLRKPLRLLCERMPVEVYQNLPLITIVAPPEWGYVIVLPVPAPGGRVIFLASQLDRRDVSRELADFAVAHAFARVALGHGATTKAADARAADRLVKQWGYKIPVYRGRFRILVDGGL